MESLRRFYLREAESAIRDTRRFRSAPADDRAGATSNIVGVEAREFRGFGSRATRPALVVQCRCGPFVGRFSLPLGDLGDAALIDEREMG